MIVASRRHVVKVLVDIEGGVHRPLEQALLDLGHVCLCAERRATVSLVRSIVASGVDRGRGALAMGADAVAGLRPSVWSVVLDICR